MICAADLSGLPALAYGDWARAVVAVYAPLRLHGQGAWTAAALDAERGGAAP